MGLTLTKIKAFKGVEDTVFEISYDAFVKAANENNETQAFLISNISYGDLQYWTGSVYAHITEDMNVFVGKTNESNENFIVTTKIKWTPPAGYYGSATPFSLQAAKSNDGVWNEFSVDPVQVSFVLKNLNDAPVILSAPNNLSVDENTTGTIIYKVEAQDIDSPKLTYTLTGNDAKLFKINKISGEITVKKAFDYEKPSDADKNNIFDLTVIASDGKLKDSQNISIALNNQTDDFTTNSSYPEIKGGYFLNTTSGNIIIYDIGKSVDITYTLFGTTYHQTEVGTVETGYTLNYDGYVSTLPGMDFQDQVISAQAMYYVGAYLPSDVTYESVPNTSGDAHTITTFITSIGVITTESAIHW